MNPVIILLFAGVQLFFTYYNSSAIQTDSIVKIVIHQKRMSWESTAQITPTEVISVDKKPVIIKDKNVLHRFRTLIQGLQIVNSQNNISSRVVCFIYTNDKKNPDTLSFGYGLTIGYNSTEASISWDLFKLVGAFLTPYNQKVIDEVYDLTVTNADAYKEYLKRLPHRMDSIRHRTDSLSNYYQSKKKE